MTSFLQIVAQDLNSKFGNNLSQITVVLPSRRPEYFLYRNLSEIIQKPLIAPEITTLPELAEKLSSYMLAGEIDLIYRLYSSYNKILGIKSDFSQFYYWGQMMLHDFNDMDLALADSSKILGSLEAFHDLDAFISHDDEELRIIVERFWKSVSSAGSGNLRNKFKEFWQKLYPIYLDFTQHCQHEKIGYYGSIIRSLVFNSEQLRHKINGMNIAIVGFDYIHSAEFELFKLFKENANTIFYWDYDTFYCTQNFEANRIMKRNLEIFPPAVEISKINHFESPKQVSIYKVPGTIPALEIAADEAKKLQQNNLAPDTTALIVPKAKYLSSLLKSMSDVQSINVTYGWPVAMSLPAEFLLLALDLINSINQSNGKFSCEILRRLSANPYFPPEERLKLETIINVDNNKLFYVSADNVRETGGVLEKVIELFNQKRVTSICITILGAIQNQITTTAWENLSEKSKLDFFICDFLNTRFNQMENVLSQLGEQLDINSQLHFSRQIILNSGMPLEGSPISGIQVMGLNETSCLDFVNVIIPCANEGNLPEIKNRHSFIPYALRKTFGLPTYEEEEAKQAYKFYRLLQRAQNIVFTVNVVETGEESPDPSRFIHQMEFYLKNRYQNHWKEQLLTYRFATPKTREISIPWSQKVHHFMNQYLQKQIKLSPTALNTYIDCSLKFYYKYICNIEEPDTDVDIIDGRVFGNLFHETVREIYGRWIGKEVQKIDIENISKKEISSIINTEYAKSSINQESGYNQLLKYIVQRYVENVLEIDKKNAPFRILGIEQEVKMPFNFEIEKKKYSVMLGGKIDRIDQIAQDEKTEQIVKINSVIRILDYKTGNPNHEIDQDILKIFEPNSPKRPKEFFQAYLYTIIYKNTVENSKTVIPGLIVTGKLHNIDNFHMFTVKKHAKLDELEEPFKENLATLLSHMFNPKATFHASPTDKICKYCFYQSLCGKRID